MKTLSQFIAEAEFLPSISKDNKLGGLGGSEAHIGNVEYRLKNPPYSDKPRNVTMTHIGKLKRNDIYHAHIKSRIDDYGEKEDPQDHYILHDPKTNMVHLHVKGEKKYGVLKVSTLSGSGKSPVKAHDFYHHLLKNHLKAMVGTSHSEGGQKVWQKLANKRTVSIHGWARSEMDDQLDRVSKNRKPVNINAKDPDETHSSWEETTRHKKDQSDSGAWGREEEPEERSRMALVASYHPLKKMKAAAKERKG